MALLCFSTAACGVGLQAEREPSGISRAESSVSSVSSAQPSAAGPLRLNDSQVHRNGVEVVLESVEFGANGTWVAFEVTNPRPTSIRLNGCCRGTYLVDNQGAIGLLQPPQGDPTIVIDGESSVSGTLFFEGKLSSRAQSFEVIFGDTDNGSQSDPDAAWPTFIFGPYFVERG